MLQLRPAEYFTIARGLSDHTDAGTYYVRAVIRDAKTDALIATVNLEDQGNRRFSYPWQVPEDPSGEGFYILITTTVYTDSGYTTKSENYGEEFTTHLVQDRLNANLLGGTPDFDYKKIQKMMSEELARQLAAMPKCEHEEGDNSAVLGAIEMVRQMIGSINIPEAKAVNFDPVLQAMGGVERLIRGIEIPKPEKVDLTPVLTAISAVMAKFENTLATIPQLKNVLERVKEFFGNDVLEIKKIVGELGGRMDKVPAIMMRDGGREEIKEQPIKRRGFQL